MRKQDLWVLCDNLKQMSTAVNTSTNAPERDEDPEKWARLNELLSSAVVVAEDLYIYKGKLVK